MTAPVVDASGAHDLALAGTARVTQLAIRARLLQDVVRLWPALDRHRLSDTFPSWLRAMMTVTRLYHRESASAAARAYKAARSHATQLPAPDGLIRLPSAPSDEWLTRAYGYAGPGMLTRDTARPNTALTTTLGTAARLAAAGGRTTTVGTVLHDPETVGWYRVTDGNPCYFCALLASRGVVYKAHSFDSSDARFHGPGEFKVHNNCGCDAAPAFRDGPPLPDVTSEARRVYNDSTGGMPNKDRLQAFRKAWDARNQ